MSFHIRKPGFFPGTGAAEEAGAGRGRGHTLNVPIADGLRDDLFLARGPKNAPPCTPPLEARPCTPPSARGLDAARARAPPC